MCDVCAAEYKKYDDLLKELTTAKRKASDARDQISGLQNTFENVRIDSEPVGNEQLKNCYSNFTFIISELHNSCLNCEKKMQDIESGCPGEDHYED